MDGFKNSTKTQYSSGGSCYAKGGAVKGAAKINKVMGEFKSGKLHSGSKSGPEVTSKKQATAIALSEARKAGAKIPMKKGGGGSVEADDALMSRMTPKEMAMGRAGIEAARARLADPKASARASDAQRAAPRNTDPSGSVRASDAQRAAPKKAVPVAPKRPLVEPRSEYGPAKSLTIPLKKGGQPVQKKSLGGVLKALSPAATLIGSDVGKDLMGSGVFGVGGVLLNQLLKKKQSGQTLTPAENQQVAQASQGAMKKGGMMHKKGVPVTSKGPRVGLAAMPKKK
jgi:hypothetical protein